MAASAILLAFLLIATITDLRQRKVFNWTTYPGILAAFTGSLVATLAGADSDSSSITEVERWGFVSITDSLIGFAACGITMLACYVFFPGGVGGGDVKLVGMIGAFLGLYQGLEAMLWTFILGGCQALVVLIWKVGAWELIRRSFTFLRFLFRTAGTDTVREEKSAPAVSMFLSPSALLAVLIVRFHVAEWLRF